MRKEEAGDLISRCATLAALLEVSAYPKPGNVHRTRDFANTRYEHFLAGSVAYGPAMRKLAIRGYDVRRTCKPWNELRIGEKILESVEDSLSWQKGGNVNLGVILLMAPLAASGGSLLVEKSEIEVERLRYALRTIVQSTTPKDAVAVCKAVSTSLSERALGRVGELDVLDSSTIRKIRGEKLTLMDLFSKCASRDTICREWTTGFEIVFTLGYPTLRRIILKTSEINAAIVNTFLTLQSRQPDSLIIRKAGLDAALEMSERAGRILEKGGASTEEGVKLLWDWDEELLKTMGMCNPGTTADLTAASIFILLMDGWRP